MPRGMGKTLEEARPDWTILEEWEGLTLGDPVKVTGESGVFRFVCHVTTSSGKTWITAHGPDGHHKQWRSFRPDRVKSAVKRRRTMK